MRGGDKLSFNVKCIVKEQFKAFSVIKGYVTVFYNHELSLT